MWQFDSASSWNSSHGGASGIRPAPAINLRMIVRAFKSLQVRSKCRMRCCPANAAIPALLKVNWTVQLSSSNEPAKAWRHGAFRSMCHWQTTASPEQR